MTTKTPEPQYRATMARNGNKGAGRKLSAKRKAALERATEPVISPRSARAENSALEFLVQPSGRR